VEIENVCGGENKVPLPDLKKDTGTALDLLPVFLSKESNRVPSDNRRTLIHESINESLELGIDRTVGE
jgi:hypothetical protein